MINCRMTYKIRSLETDKLGGICNRMVWAVTNSDKEAKSGN